MTRATGRMSLLAFPLATLLAAAPAAHGAPPAPSDAPAPAGGASAAIARMLAPVAAASRARDSLSQVADRTSGAERDVLEEQVWQRQLEVQAGLVATATEMERLKQRGLVGASSRQLLDDAVRRGWPRYVAQLERRNATMQSMLEQRDTAGSGHERLARETQLAEYAGRTARMYQDLVGALLALERLGVDVAAQREWVLRQLWIATSHTTARMTVLGREQALATARVSRTPDDAAARIELDAVELGMGRTVSALETEIVLLERLGQDVTPLQVQLILGTGKLSTAVLDVRVIQGLLRHAQERVLDTLARHAPRWLFQVLLLAAILAAFRVLAGLTRKGVRRLVERAELSQLMRDTLAAWSSRLVMVIGLVVVLRQLGVQVGPMLAGVGIAGVVVGLALQDTLANFAAGAMILAYHPFDVGDIIESGGVLGTVRRMSLVSTTVVTFDNQTLIVPNKRVWGDVIRNLTAQGTRRVDLLFSAGYGDAVEHVERVLERVVAANPRVLRDPAPLVKVHELGESGVKFAVRVWVRHEDYWDVYWDVTRAVKLEFDREGIQIPYPQRELHLNVRRGPEAGGDVVDAARPAGPPTA